jgi:hypothetical protein
LFNNKTSCANKRIAESHTLLLQPHVEEAVRPREVYQPKPGHCGEAARDPKRVETELIVGTLSAQDRLPAASLPGSVVGEAAPVADCQHAPEEGGAAGRAVRGGCLE